MWDGDDGGRGAGKKTYGNARDRQAVLDKAREEREARKAAQAKATAAVKIQKLARGWTCTRSEKARVREELNKKCRDVEKVQQVVQATYSKKFVVPCATLQELIRMANFSFDPSNLEDMDLLRFLAECASTALENDPAQFSIKGVESSVKMQHLVRMGRFCKACVRSAFGTHFARDIVIRRRSFDESCGIFVSFLELLLSRGDEETHRWFVSLASGRTKVFSLIDEYCLGMACLEIPSEEFSYTERLKEQCASMLQLAFHLLENDADDQTAEEVLKILQVPLLTYRIPQDVLQSTFKSSLLFPRSLSGNSRIQFSIAALGKRKSNDVPSCLWTFGNLISILYTLREGDNWSAFIREALIKLGNLLLEIPSKTFSGKMAVLWVSNEQCVAMPDLLNQQLNLITSLALSQSLAQSCFFVNEAALGSQRVADDKAWESKSKLLEDKSVLEPSLKAPSSKTVYDRIKDAWQSSSWSKFLGGKKKPNPSMKTGVLRNVSHSSRQLATGEVSSSSKSESTGSSTAKNSGRPFDLSLAQSCARFFAIFLWLWPPGTQNVIGISLLNSLSFASSSLIYWLWYIIDSSAGSEKHFARASFDEMQEGVQSLLLTFCTILQHSLLITDDEELYEQNQPLHLNQIEKVISTLKDQLFRTILKGVGDGGDGSNGGLCVALARSASLLLSTLYERHSRRGICPPSVWLVAQLNFKNGIANLGSSVSEQTKNRLVREMPYGIPFAERVRLFQQLLANDRAVHQPNGVTRHRFRVRRTAIFEDGFHHLSQLGADMKGRLYVIFVNAAGHDETGIDAGGLFKEFWTSLSAVAFDQQYGLFNVTSDQLLYPNPQSQVVHGTEHLALFEFLGTIVGKAMYEEIVIQPRFARFFLSKFLGRYSFIGDLPSLDLELYKNLMFLKTYDGDIRDLCLTFAVSEEQFGQTHQVDLIPGGSNVEVTSQNKFRYVNLVADYHLNKRGNAQSLAFLRGFVKLIHPEWIRMFTQPELQTLISGSTVAFDVQDLKKNTIYANGFLAMDRSVARFWKVVEELSDQDKALLLKFVTSCERPPLLGFGSLQPPFCIHRIPISSDDEMLVTASTCFNTLKLPTYSSSKVLKEKLLLSIRSGSGFELT